MVVLFSWSSFFLQIGDTDEAEKNVPDEEAEDLNRNSKSVVDNSGTDEQQQVESTLVSPLRGQPSLFPECCF